MSETDREVANQALKEAHSEQKSEQKSSPKKSSPKITETDEDVPVEEKPGLGALAGEGVGAAAKHEFTAEDRTNAHRLVATSMIIVFLVVAISQNWWKHLRDFVSTKTHGPATVTPPGGGNADGGNAGGIAGKLVKGDW